MMEITFDLAVKRQDFKEVHSRYEHVKRGRGNGNIWPSYVTDCVAHRLEDRLKGEVELDGGEL